jgi:hypothetical protein
MDSLGSSTLQVTGRVENAVDLHCGGAANSSSIGVGLSRLLFFAERLYSRDSLVTCSGARILASKNDGGLEHLHCFLIQQRGGNIDAFP